jgi:hypothetical protein
MPGDPSAGAVLRELRRSHRLTLSAVARRAGCAASLISQVESGSRAIQPWLAAALDDVYAAGGSVAALAAVASSGPGEPGTGDGEVVVVHLPSDQGSMVVSRRDALMALSIGVMTAPLAALVPAAPSDRDEAEATLSRFETALAGFGRAGRRLPGRRVADAMLGNVLVLEGLRQVGHPELRTRLLRLQTRYAESLSWLNAEVGDLLQAVYWTDRCAVWAQAAEWPAMVAYTFVRRSMMALSFSDAAAGAVQHANQAARLPGAPAGVRALAAKQAAYGYALAGQAEESVRALDTAVRLFAAAERDDDPASAVGQRSVLNEDLQAVYAGTCRVYLGKGLEAVEELSSRLDRVAAGSARTHAITAARIARAAADAGDPALACERIRTAVELAEAVGSLSAKAELRRAEPVLLRRWPRRGDVQDIVRLLQS